MKNYRLYRWNPITNQWTAAETFATLEEAVALAESQRDRSMYRAGTWWRVYWVSTLAIKAEVK